MTKELAAKLLSLTNIYLTSEGQKILKDMTKEPKIYESK